MLCCNVNIFKRVYINQRRKIVRDIERYGEKMLRHGMQG